MARLPLVGLALVLAACSVTDTAAPPADLRADREAYVRGDSVRVTLENLSGAPLYGSVPSCVGFETRTVSGWEPVPSWPEACRLLLFVLEPDTTVTAAFAVPEGVPAGTYRFTKSLSTTDAVAPDDVMLATPPFTISGPSIAGLVFQAKEESFTATDSTVTLVLENGTGGVVRYNLCHSDLQRETDGQWVDVPDDRVCTDELRALDPGEAAEERLPLPDELVTAGYRYETRIEIEADGERTDRTICSRPFGLPRP